MNTTQCPVCGVNLEGPADSVTQHVNMCIDNKESLNCIGNLFTNDLTSAALSGTRSFGYCPICFRLAGVDAQHIKKCGQSRGIQTKELIKMCSSDKPSKSKSKAPRGRNKKQKEPHYGPGCSREIDDDPKKALKEKTKEIEKPKTDFLFKPEKPKKEKKPRKPAEKKNKDSKTRQTKGKLNQAKLQLNGLTIKLVKPIGISNNELVKLSKEEKEQRIRHKINLILTENLCPDNYVYTSSTLAPYIWRISSLNSNDVDYIVKGFERFCIDSQERTAQMLTKEISLETKQEVTNEVDQLSLPIIPEKPQENVSLDLPELSESMMVDESIANITMIEPKDMTLKLSGSDEIIERLPQIVSIDLRKKPEAVSRYFQRDLVAI